MNAEQVLTEMQEIFRDFFDDSNLVLTRDTSAADVEGWDSLAQISLVEAFKRKFQIKCSLIELAALNNVGDMIDLVVKKLA